MKIIKILLIVIISVNLCYSGDHIKDYEQLVNLCFPEDFRKGMEEDAYLSYKNRRIEELKKINEVLPNILSTLPNELIDLVNQYSDDLILLLFVIISIIN